MQRRNGSTVLRSQEHAVVVFVALLPPTNISVRLLLEPAGSHVLEESVCVVGRELEPRGQRVQCLAVHLDDLLLVVVPTLVARALVALELEL